MERSDASFQQCTMPHDTTAENCNTRSNTAETAEISSHWKSAENADFPSRWKFGPYEQKNGGGIVLIPPPRALRRAYAVSCRETKNPNPLPTANRFGFFDFGGPNRDRTDDLTDANRTLSRTRHSTGPVLWAVRGFFPALLGPVYCAGFIGDANHWEEASE